MQTGKIVWVFGCSGAGKETFLRHIQTHHPEDLLKQLGWFGQIVKICEKSIEWVAQFDGDPVGDKRSGIPEKLAHMAKNEQNVVVLVKGQDLDLENNRLTAVKELLPNHEHHILFLQASMEEVVNRIRNKPWWSEKYDEDEMQKWLDYQKSLLHPLQQDFHVTVLSSEHGDSYPVIGHEII